LVSSRKKLLTNKINLKPVKEFINDKSNKFIKGDDPLSGFATQKVFSAYPLKNNMLYAYIYVVLNGEKKKVESDNLFTSYLLQISYRTMGITFFLLFDWTTNY
jgi:hypothetical protein